LTKEELQFLPAALEIIETPPSPIGRALTWLLMALFTIALIWSIVGRIDEVAVAQGRVVPSGFTNVVQAEDSGIVSRIHVENGSRVRQGDILIELDTVMTEADVTRLTQERDFYQLTLMRLAAEEGMEPFTPARLRHISPLERERQMRLYQSRMEDYRSRLSVAQKSIAQAEEQVRQARIVRQRFATQVTMAREREERVRIVARANASNLVKHCYDLIDEFHVQNGQFSNCNGLFLLMRLPWYCSRAWRHSWFYASRVP